jgi:hypothetical protein
MNQAVNFGSLFYLTTLDDEQGLPSASLQARLTIDDLGLN